MRAVAEPELKYAMAKETMAIPPSEVRRGMLIPIFTLGECEVVDNPERIANTWHVYYKDTQGTVRLVIYPDDIEVEVMASPIKGF